MFKFLKKIKKNKLKKGFTLVETLVALSIFIISVVGIMTVLATGLTNITNAKNKMIATFLAQEGIEYVRNVRDTYVLYDPNGSGDAWNDFKAYTLLCTSGCYLDTISLDFLEQNHPITASGIVKNCSNNNCPTITYNSNTGKYLSGGAGGGVKTVFVRKITLSLIENDEIKATSTVTWGSGNSKSVSFTQNLFNWIE